MSGTMPSTSRVSALPLLRPPKPAAGDAPPGPGPRVARLVHAGLGAVLVLAWASLGVQVRALVGAEGLEPARALLAAARAAPDWGFWSMPSVFWLGAPDALLLGGCGLGVVLGVLAGAGRRWALAASAALYLSYIHVAPTFLAFQWDNLLVEACVIGALLPRSHPSRWAHFAWRLLFVKVFFLSGVAKALSGEGDWLGGTAMAHYYETAPLPTWLGWWLHQAPAAWHLLESWATLFFELVLVWGAFGGSRLRRVVLAAAAAFVVLDALTANYGFFLALTSVLALGLLDDGDLTGRAGRWLGPTGAGGGPPDVPRAQAGATAAAVVLWAALSALAAVGRFGPVAPGAALVEAAAPLRVANVYHLFGTVTKARVEPEIQVRTGEGPWTPLHLRFKPGDAAAAPGFVAPHQPRLDFQLWFHALRWKGRAPAYLRSLVAGVCAGAARVQPFFGAPLPAAPDTLRIVYWDSRFTDRAERAETGEWWARRVADTSDEVDCAALRAPRAGPPPRRDAAGLPVDAAGLPPAPAGDPAP